MRILSGIEAYDLGPSVVCMGKFDGVHIGHQKLLREAVSLARATGVSSVALTFDRHPLVLLRPELAPPPLMNEREKCQAIENLGVDVLIVIEFTQELAGQTANSYLDKICGCLSPVAIVCGQSYRFGRGALGSAQTIRQQAQARGYSALIVPPETLDGEAVSSTAIREAMARGDTARARKMLGREP